MALEPRDLDALADELSWAFSTEAEAMLVVARSGFPRNQVPRFTNALAFWTTVVHAADDGALLVDRLVRAAARLRPGRRYFRRSGTGAGPAHASSLRPATNLPHSRIERPFVGREEELAQLRALFDDLFRPATVVLRGAPGFGKVQLALRFAVEAEVRYPGGRYFISLTGSGPPTELLALPDVVGTRLEGLELYDRCHEVLNHLGRYEPALLIYVDVPDRAFLDEWGPSDGNRLHVLATTEGDWRSTSPPSISIQRMPSRDAHVLVRSLLGSEELDARFGDAIVELGDGVPIQLEALANLVRMDPDPTGLELERECETLDREVEKRYARLWRKLSYADKELLQHCALYEPARLPPQRELLEPLGPHARAAYRECCSMSLLEPEGRMPRPLATFVRSRAEHRPPMPRYQEHARAFIAAARALDDAILGGASETLAPALARFECFPARREVWREWQAHVAPEPLLNDAYPQEIGFTLSRTGRFAEAIAWLEQPDFEGLPEPSWSLYQAGYCAFETGRLDDAKRWYDAAIEHDATTAGDTNPTDHELLARCRAGLGDCALARSDYAEALEWFRQSLTEHEKVVASGGAVNHDGLGASIHQIGVCLMLQGEREQARGEDEQARLRFADAHTYFARAVQEKQRGDQHEHVHHCSVGASLHQCGAALAALGRYEDALRSLKRAVVHHRRGDGRGHIDGHAIGMSLDRQARCWDALDRPDVACLLLAIAIEHKQRGDVHGRVDHHSIGLSLDRLAHSSNACGDEDGARAALEEAIAHKQRGDRHGWVDQESVAASKHELATLGTRA